MDKGAGATMGEEYVLRLEDALWRAPEPSGPGSPDAPESDPHRADLEVYLYRDGDRWRARVLGYALFHLPGATAPSFRPPRAKTYNEMDHEGEILSQETDAGLHRLGLAMDIAPDFWRIAGGRAEYRLEFRLEGGWARGQYHGSFRGREVTGSLSGAAAPGPWPAPVAGHVPVTPGEHPRLIFRRAGLPELRRRAGLPGGREILARLREELAGPWTCWHAVGHGLLYLLEGDPAHAAEARRQVEAVLSGKVDGIDHRYWWGEPKVIRHGPVVAAVALAYDFCHDAWDQDWREWLAGVLARELVALTRGGGQGFEPNPMRNWYGVYNSSAGLVALAIRGDARTYAEPDPPAGRMSLRPDTPAEVEAQLQAWKARSDAYLRPDSPVDPVDWALPILERRLKRHFGPMGGWGDRGWFFEGHHYSRFPSSQSLLPFLVAYRVAAGLDLSTGAHGHWLLLRWLMDAGRGPAADARGGKPPSRQDDPGRGEDRPPPGLCRYLRRSRAGGGDDRFGERGTCFGGEFAVGFGLCPPELQPAALWFHAQMVRDPGEPPYNLGDYPHRAPYALAFWPFGLEPENPARALPRAMGDRKGYYVFRDRWEGEGDIIVTLHTNYEGGEVGPAPILLWGLGLRLRGEDNPFRGVDLYGARTGRFATGEDGSGGLELARDLPAGRHTAVFAVDYGGACGAPALLVLRERGKPPGNRNAYDTPGAYAFPRGRADGDAWLALTSLPAPEGERFWVATLQKGAAPPVEALGPDHPPDGFRIGGREARLEDGRVRFQA